MPYIFVTGYYPTHKVPEVVKKWFEARKKFPPGEGPDEIVVEAATTANKDGLETVTISKVTHEDLGEALLRIMRSMVLYQPIEGFEYSIMTYSSLEDALESVGMKMPD